MSAPPSFPSPATVQRDGCRQNLLRPSRADAFAKVRQLARVARQAPLQLPLPAEILRVGVFAPKHDDLLIAEVPQALEH